MDGHLINDAAARTGVTADTLRYWERAGVVPPAPRDAQGRRVYDAVALGWIDYAQCLRALGMGVSEVAAYVAEATGAARPAAMRELLGDHLARMEAQHEQLTGWIATIRRKLATLEHDG